AAGPVPNIGPRHDKTHGTASLIRVPLFVVATPLRSWSFEDFIRCAGSFIWQPILRRPLPARVERVSLPDELQLKRERESQAAEAPPRGDPARQAPAGTEAARVQADDVRPDRGQGARPDRGDPAAPDRGEEAREGP